MNASRRTDIAAPNTEARETLPGGAGQRRRADVSGESPTISADIEIAVIHKHVIVERVIELGSQLQVHAFGQSRLFRNTGKGTFVDATRSSGLFGRQGFSTSAAWFDYDRLDFEVVQAQQSFDVPFSYS